MKLVEYCFFFYLLSFASRFVWELSFVISFVQIFRLMLYVCASSVKKCHYIVRERQNSFESCGSMCFVIRGSESFVYSFVKKKKTLR